MRDQSPTRRNRYGEPTPQSFLYRIPRLPRFPYRIPRLRRNRYGLPKLVSRSPNPKTPKKPSPKPKTPKKPSLKPKTLGYLSPKPKTLRHLSLVQRVLRDFTRQPEFRSVREKVGYYVFMITTAAAMGMVVFLEVGSLIASVVSSACPPLMGFVGWRVWMRWGRARFPRAIPQESDS